MNFRVPPAFATAAAALAGGVFLGQMMELGADVFGAGPGAVATAGALAAAGLSPRSSTGRTQGVFSVLAAGALWRAEDVLGFAGRVVDADLLPGCAAALLFLLARAVGRPFADALRRVRPVHALLAAAGLAAGWTASRELALLFVVVNAVVMRGVSSPLRSLRRPELARGAWRTALAVVPCAVGWLLIALARPGVDPTAAPWMLAGMGLLGGIGLAFHPGMGLLGLATMAGVVALTVRAPEVWLGWGPLGGAALAGAVGLGAGLGAGALRPNRVIAGIVPVGIGLGWLALPWVPEDLVERLARAKATVPAEDLPTVETTRATLPRVWVGTTGAGSAILRAREGRLQLELDGTTRTPDQHTGAAEVLAGLLAGCSTAGRAHALVTGDELGLVSSALQAQGFLLIDNAAPLPELRRAIADTLPLARRTWLHPSLRLLPLAPAALPLTSHGADVFVEVVPQPWSGLPDARRLAFVRRQLDAGGSYVLALGATRMADDVLRGVLHDVAAVWPATSLWLPPDGVDTLLVVGTAAPLPWSQVHRCRVADADRASRLRISTDLDLGALAHADGDTLRVLHGAPPRRGVPPEARGAPSLPTALLTALDPHPERIFAADAPLPELEARARSRAAWLTLVANAGTTGAAPAPATRALDPLIAPLLKQARSALERARAEGLLSKAWAEADGAARAAIALSPSSAAAHCLLGTLDAERGQWSPAATAFQTCATLDPGSIAAWDGLASVRQAQNDLVGAEDALRKALAIAPQQWQRNHNLGLLLARLGRLTEAEELLKKGAALAAQAGDDAAPHLALASLYLRTDRSALALVEAEKAMGLGASADAWYFHGAASWDLDHPEIAERDFREALTADPRHVLARGGLGLAQARRGDYEAAALSFQAVLAADPQNVDAKKNLALLLPRVNPDLLKTAPSTSPSTAPPPSP